MRTAIVVTEPNGQVVHLPAEIRLAGDEVFVKQVGKSVVLVPKHLGPWQTLVDSLDQFTADYMDELPSVTALCEPTSSAGGARSDRSIQ